MKPARIQKDGNPGLRQHAEQAGTPLAACGPRTEYHGVRTGEWLFRLPVRRIGPRHQFRLHQRSTVQVLRHAQHRHQPGTAAKPCPAGEEHSTQHAGLPARNHQMAVHPLVGIPRAGLQFGSTRQHGGGGHFAVHGPVQSQAVEHQFPAVIGTIRGVLSEFAADEGHREIGAYAGIERPAGITGQPGGKIDGNHGTPAGADGPDEFRGDAFRRPGQSGTEHRIDHQCGTLQNAAVTGCRAPSGFKVSPAHLPCVRRSGFGGGSDVYLHADLMQQPGHHVAVPAVVAGPAQHDHRHMSGIPAHDLVERASARPFHEFQARGSEILDGDPVKLPDLGRGVQGDGCHERILYRLSRVQKRKKGGDNVTTLP